VSENAKLLVTLLLKNNRQHCTKTKSLLLTVKDLCFQIIDIK